MVFLWFRLVFLWLFAWAGARPWPEGHGGLVRPSRAAGPTAGGQGQAVHFRSLNINLAQVTLHLTRQTLLQDDDDGKAVFIDLILSAFEESDALRKELEAIKKSALRKRAAE